MKAVITSVAVLCSVILTVVLVAIYSNKALRDFKSTVDSLSDEGTSLMSGIADIEKEYQEIKLFLSLFVRDNESKDVEMYIEDIKSAARENDEAALITAKSRLRLHIEQLRRLSAFSLEAIF